MAVFACTSCAQDEYFIPEMLRGPLKGIVILSGFLDAYQKNFRVLVFESRRATVRYDYPARVKFCSWQLIPVPDLSPEGNRVGGEPRWLLEDESPATYDDRGPMGFLMQLQEEYEFERLPDAPPQATQDLRGRVEDSTDPFYSLFLGNRIFFFGTTTRRTPQVYILTQVD